MGLSCGIICVILYFVILIQYGNVTDTHTLTHDDGIYCASIASHGKNYFPDVENSISWS